MALLMLFSLCICQVVLVNGGSVTIGRIISSGKEGDSFQLPKSYEWCNRHNACSRFDASFSPRLTLCKCSCAREKASTFSRKNGFWQCIDNKEFRERELKDCKRTYFINETASDPLKIFKSAQTVLDINPKGKCTESNAQLSYQACNGEWKFLNKTSDDWKVQVTHKWANSSRSYVLEIKKAQKSKDLGGKIVKLEIQCDDWSEKLCLLFKVAGHVTCPIEDIPAHSIPSTVAKRETSTSTATAKTSVKTQSKFPATPISKAPAYVTSILKVTWRHPWKTEGNTKTIQKALHEESIPLITGIAASAVFVLLGALFVGWLMRRKKKKKHSHTALICLKQRTTKADDSNDQYTEAEDRPQYQSLSRLPEGATPRGMYVARYKVPASRADPEGRYPFKPAYESTDRTTSEEYDYAESSLVVRSKMPKISIQTPNEEALKTTQEKAPYYHVLEIEEEGLLHEGPRDDAYKVPDEREPDYRVPEEPNLSDSQNNEGAYYMAKEMDPYYHILEETNSTDVKSENQIGPTNETNEESESYYMVRKSASSPGLPHDKDYKELQADECESTSYQALHKYSYITVGGPTMNRQKQMN